MLISFKSWRLNFSIQYQYFSLFSLNHSIGKIVLYSTDGDTSQFPIFCDRLIDVCTLMAKSNFLFISFQTTDDIGKISWLIFLYYTWNCPLQFPVSVFFFFLTSGSL